MLMFPNIVAFLFFPNCQKQDYVIYGYFFLCIRERQAENGLQQIISLLQPIYTFKSTYSLE